MDAVGGPLKGNKHSADDGWGRRPDSDSDPKVRLWNDAGEAADTYHVQRLVGFHRQPALSLQTHPEGSNQIPSKSFNPTAYSKREDSS